MKLTSDNAKTVLKEWRRYISWQKKQQARQLSEKTRQELQARIDRLGPPIHYPGADIPIPAGKPTYNKLK